MPKGRKYKTQGFGSGAETQRLRITPGFGEFLGLAVPIY